MLSITWLTAKSDNDRSPKELIETYYNKLKEVIVLQNQNNYPNQTITELIQELIDVPKISQMVLGKRWKKLNEYEQGRFVNAMSLAIQRKLLEEIKRYGDTDIPDFTFVSEESKENFAKLIYRLKGTSGNKDVALYFLATPEKGWKISNIIVNNKSLVRYYYSFCKKILDKYSLAYLEAELSDLGYVILEDFEDNTPGKFPSDWTWRKRDQKKHKPYVVRMEDSNHYLAAEDNGESVIIGKNIKWNIKKYPYISFKWRAHKLPVGGDERYGKTVDSAAGLYIVYKKKLGLIPESVKYVWSTTLPIGSTMRRSGVGKPWMIVAESGDKHVGEWRTYVFNIYEAYKKTFGGDPPDKVLAIGILSDANSTHSQAYADYDDIIALRNAQADSGVKKILEAE
ncbi:MAG: DUF3047 domain-containing protein [Calditrichaeota bacterium]|nr:MAG: DUF3047 domain-containing protein [Calditrichota bacterium]